MSKQNPIIKVEQNAYGNIHIARKDGTDRMYNPTQHTRHSYFEQDKNTEAAWSRTAFERVSEGFGIWVYNHSESFAGHTPKTLMMPGSETAKKLSITQQRCLIGLVMGDFSNPTGGRFPVTTVQKLYRLGMIEPVPSRHRLSDKFQDDFKPTEAGRKMVAEKVVERNLNRDEAAKAIEASEQVATLMRQRANDQYRGQSFSPVGVRFEVSNQNEQYMQARIGKYAIVRQTSKGISLFVSETARFGSTGAVQVADEDLHKFFEAMYVAKQLVAIMDTPLDFS